MIDDGYWGEIGAMKFGRGSRSTRTKTHPVPLFPGQIPHDLTRVRTRTAAVEYIHLEELYQVKVPV
jgi:hypothetical protein